MTTQDIEKIFTALKLVFPQDAKTLMKKIIAYIPLRVQ